MDINYKCLSTLAALIIEKEFNKYLFVCIYSHFNCIKIDLKFVPMET